jgi:putative tryptophan/tyrosine transport system substrate-binding protein
VFEGQPVRRRVFITLVGGAAAGWPLAARAQQSAMPVIGYLGFGSPEGFATRRAAFRQGLQETGYREGENVKIEYRWAKGQNDQLPGLAADLVRHQVNVIATPGSANAARAAKSATATIPIVFETGVDPVATGLVASLNRPNGNITGVSSLNVQVGQKRLEVLHQLLPTTTVVAALVNPTNMNTEVVAEDLQAAAKSLGLRLHILHASSQSDFDVIFLKLPQLGADALIVNPDPFFIGESGQLVALTLRERVPTLFFSRDFVAAGGLLSYGGSVAESHRQAGIYTGRILKGAKPADLPIQQVTKFELVINLKTAKTLGLTVPQDLIVAADEVIE